MLSMYSDIAGKIIRLSNLAPKDSQLDCGINFYDDGTMGVSALLIINGEYTSTDVHVRIYQFDSIEVNMSKVVAFYDEAKTMILKH